MNNIYAYQALRQDTVIVSAMGDNCCQLLDTLCHSLTPTNCFLMLAYSAVEGCAIVGSLFGTRSVYDTHWSDR